MGIVAATFIGILALIMGLYWVLVIRPERAADDAIRKRLRGEVTVERKASVVFRSGERLSEIPVLERMLAGSHALGLGLQDLLARSGVQVSAGTVVLTSALLGVVVFEVVELTRPALLAALVLGATAASAPLLYLRHKAEKRMRQFEELFPEAIGLIIRALRAGHAFTTGLSMVAEELKEPVGPEFRILFDEQNFGMPVEDALKRLARRIPIIDVRFFVTAVLTQRDAGGNLAEVLENLTAVVRDRFKVKRQVRVVTAHARLSGFILMVLPIACAVFMLLMAPEQMRVLWTDPVGRRMLAAAAALQVVGVLVIRRLVKIEY
jgi:tight adherence protein B